MNPRRVAVWFFARSVVAFLAAEIQPMGRANE